MVQTNIIHVPIWKILTMTPLLPLRV